MEKQAATTEAVPDTKERIQKIQQRIAGESLDALLITSAANKQYLTNFSGSTSWVVVSPDRCAILVDGRYTEQAQQECPSHVEKLPISDYVGNFPKELVSALQKLKVKRLGIEANHTSLLEARQMEENCAVTLVSTMNWVETLRMKKTGEEIQRIQEAIAAAEKAMQKGMEAIQPGVQEKEVAWKIMEAIHKQGGKEAFASIVASGFRSAMPHGRATNRQLQKGDVVVVDMGACIQGYNSDITRTVFLGDPPGEVKKIFSLLQKAQEAAIQAIRPGVPAKAVDGAARKLIQDADYGEAFCHGLGHGIGLEVHEAPSLRKTGEQTLEAGMVVTVEPGVYLAEKFGLRLEDDVLVTDGGCQILSSFPQILQLK